MCTQTFSQDGDVLNYRTLVIRNGLRYYAQKSFVIPDPANSCEQPNTTTMISQDQSPTIRTDNPSDSNAFDEESYDDGVWQTETLYLTWTAVILTIIVLLLIVASVVFCINWCKHKGHDDDGVQHVEMRFRYV